MNKATKLLVGDRVRISKASRYYTNDTTDESNPRGVTGTIETVYNAEYCYIVKWDNGKKNGYTEGDLYLYRGDNKFERKKQDKLTVTKEFLLEAYKAACSDWKKKLEQEFPEVFKTDKYPTLFELKQGEVLSNATLYVRISSKGNREYVPLNGIEIVDGVADGRILPQQARHKALYIRPELLGFGEYEIKHKATDNGRSGSHVVYFEKK